MGSVASVAPVLLLCACMLLSCAQAGTLLSVEVQLYVTVTSGEGSVMFTFTTESSIPSDGTIKLYFPQAFSKTSTGTVTSPPKAGYQILDGTLAASAFVDDGTNQVMTITRTGATASTAGATHNIRLTDIINPPSAGNYNTWKIYTTTSLDVTLDSIVSGLSTTITGTLTFQHEWNEERLEKSAKTSMQAYFHTGTSVPADGQIVITFPSAYTLSSVTSCVAYTASGYTDIAAIDGSFSVSTSGSDIICTRAGDGTATTSGLSHAIAMETVVNPTSAGTQTFSIATKDSLGNTIEEGSGATVFIVEEAALNDVAITMEHYEYSSVGFMKVAFTTTTGGEIATDGKILIYPPNGFSFPSLAALSCISSGSTTLTGTFETTYSEATPKLITIARNGDGEQGAADTVYAMTCSNVINPSGSGQTESFQLSVTSSSSIVVATIASGVYVTILTVGSLTSPTVSLSSDLRYATASLTLSFTATNSIAADGLIQVTYPADFTLSSATTSTSSTIDGSFAVTVVGQVVTVTRSGGTATSAGASLSIILSSNTNPAVEGTTATFQINTQTASGTIVDQTLAGLSVTISSTATLPSLSVSLSRTEYGAIGDITITFTARTAIPSDGLILLTLPSGFSFPTGYTQTASSPSSSSNTLDGTFAVSTSGSVLTMTRSDGTNSIVDNEYVIVVTNIQSTTTVGVTSTFGISIATAASGMVLEEYIDNTATATISSTGAINSASITSLSETVEQPTTLTFIFTTTASIPSDGGIKIDFPSGYTVSTDSSRTAVSEATARRTGCVAIDGVLTVEDPVLSTTYSLSVIRSGGTATAAGDCHSLAINLITNPSVSGPTGTFTITTTDAGGLALNVIASGVTVTLEACINSCNFHGTCVDGMCYCDEWLSGSYCQDEVPQDFMRYLKQATYELDWGNVPESQPDREDFQGFILSRIYCSCDLTSDACDLGCACDDLCSANQFAMVTSWSSITNNTANVRKCDQFDFWNKSQPLVTFNGRGLVYQYSHWLEQELCVEHDNNPSDGDFWKDPGALTAKEMSDSIGESSHQFTAEPTLSPYREITTYVYGDQMKTTETVDAITGNFLRLPAALNDGECMQMSSARFLMDVTNNTCTFYTKALSADCVSELSSSAYINNVAVAATAASDPAFVTIAVTGSETASFATSTCSNALLGIAYTVVHDNSGTIISIQAVVTTGDVSAVTNTDRASVSQTFSIRFVTSTAELPPVVLSGSIGYIAGSSVMAGLLSTSGTQRAISQYVDGLTVDTTVAGASPTVPVCGTSSTTNRIASIRFEESASLCCDMELTLDELKTACETAVTTQHVSSGTYLGMWGGSKYNNLADWMLLPDTVSPDEEVVSLWENETLTCHNMYQGSERLQMVYGYEGPLNNPQGRLIAARQEWEPQTLQWPDFLDITTTQRFPVCYTISWRQLSNTSKQTSSFGHHAFYPLFINEDWGMPAFEKNTVVCFIGVFLVFCFGKCLMWSTTLPLLSIDVHSLVRII